MRGKTRIRFGLLLGLGLVPICPRASAQVQLGSETTLNLNASASVGYTRTWNSDESDGVAYGFDGTLTGFYHDPRFLNFLVHPYLNQSNVNSSFNSSSFASGLTSQANLIDTSKTPIQITYSRDHDRQSTLNVPGTLTNYQTIGNDQTFAVNASYLPEDWPTLTAFFAHGGSDYEIVGVRGTGRSHSNLFGVNSNYDLWGTTITGGYSRSYLNSEAPSLGENVLPLTQDTVVDAFHVAATRSLLPWAILNTSFSRSGVHGAYQEVSVDSTFDTVSANLGLTPTKRFNQSFYMNYSSNLSAQVFTNVIGGTGTKQGSAGTLSASDTSGGLEGARYSAESLGYGTSANYLLVGNLSLTGGIDRRVQGQFNGLPDFESTTMRAGVSWSRRLIGGSVGLYNGVTYSFFPVYSYENTGGVLKATSSRDSSFLGNTSTINYSRNIGAWNASASFGYTRGLTVLLVGYTQESYSTGGSLSRNFHNFSVSMHGTYSKSNVEGVNQSDSKSTNYGFSVAYKNFGLGANYAQGEGTAFQLATSTISGMPLSVTIPELLTRFTGESYGAGLNWRPIHRLNLNASYSRALYSTLNQTQSTTAVNSSNTQYYARADYSFRQMYLYVGYNYVSQGFSTVLVPVPAFHTFYMGVTRYFNFF